ncbi:discoidin domain-containing protein [Thalassotalea sp. G2M2-11]|uniref:discoidin domain-containing protein n=1 Tax=Thalassotalea sp. G2M2-11 TaxID=2787627 RepID=UPI0019D098C5|nr:discoidin domain-containing protein [Thalassotalea sp. G2M2-11]
MNKARNFRLTLPMVLITSVLSACGGGDNDPDANDIPVTPVTTSAELAGSVVKGNLSGAAITVEALNGSTLTPTGQVLTDSNGQYFVELTSQPGFGINSLVKLTVSADANTSMICDATSCGDANLGDSISGELIAGTELTTLGQLSVDYGNHADGNADGQMQANVLTTLATELIEQAMLDGRNVSTPELLSLAQAEYSSLLLRALGWQTNNTNVFTTPVVSAEHVENFVTGSECQTTEQGDEQCSDIMAEETVIKLSLLNAAFAQFESTSTQQAHLQAAREYLALAIDGDADALAALRAMLYQALLNHSVAIELGYSADSVIDLALALFDAKSSGGPIHEITTDENIASATLTARFSISDAEGAAQAFDGDVNTKWLDHNEWQGAPSVEDPAWIQIDFAEPQAVNTLMITSANDASARDPENFTLVASNDGETWSTLLDMVGASFEERFERQTFSFANALKYRHYRLNITKNAGNDGLMQLAEIDLLGPIYTSLVHSANQNAVITARNSIGDGENQDKAFDGDVTTKWLDHNDWQGAPSEADPSWIQMDFPQAVAVDKVAITSANDAPSRDPENFNLQASNDGGSTWITLETWVGEAFDERFERKTFQTTNVLAYTSYRLNITKNAGNDGLMQVAEIEFIGPELAGLEHSLMAGASYSARFSISDAEGAAQAFDGDVNTKWLDHNDWQGAPSDEDPAWIQVDLPEAKVVNTLTLTSANDAPERDPENFTLLGSNDGGESWVTLASWVGEAFDQRFERKAFNFSNVLAYSSYRLNVTKNANNDGLLQIAEVGLIGPQYAAVDHSEQAGAIYSARNSISDGESEAQAFDNDSTTKWLDHNDWQGAPSVDDPSWIQVDLVSAQIVSSLAITSANDAPARDPENFQLLGSNDGGSTWVEIGNWVGESWDERFERKQFDFVNGFAFSSYRLTITKNKNNDGLMQLAEIELIGILQ